MTHMLMLDRQFRPGSAATPRLPELDPVFDRIADRTLMLRVASTDIGQLARDVAARFAPVAAEQRLLLHTNLPGCPVRADCDAGRIVLVLSNLVANALKFTPRGGRVEVTVRGSDRHVALCVRDSGVGIRADEQRSIFEHCSQLRRPRRDGLHVARAIVEAHGGALTVDSMPGRGSTFRFHLPRHMQRQAWDRYQSATCR